MRDRFVADTFVVFHGNTRVDECQEILGSLPQEFEKPRYLVLWDESDQLWGIIPCAALDWEEPGTLLSALPDATRPRSMVAYDAIEAEKAAAVKATGLALQTAAGEPQAVLRPPDLGMDAAVQLTGSPLAPLAGNSQCPHCAQPIMRYRTTLLRNKEGKFVYQRQCPHCNRLVSTGS
jgi:hypothetical protein